MPYTFLIQLWFHEIKLFPKFDEFVSSKVSDKINGCLNTSFQAYSDIEPRRLTSTVLFLKLVTMMKKMKSKKIHISGPAKFPLIQYLLKMSSF